MIRAFVVVTGAFASLSGAPTAPRELAPQPADLDTRVEFVVGGSQEGSFTAMLLPVAPCGPNSESRSYQLAFAYDLRSAEGSLEHRTPTMLRRVDLSEDPIGDGVQSVCWSGTGTWESTFRVEGEKEPVFTWRVVGVDPSVPRPTRPTPEEFQPSDD